MAKAEDPSSADPRVREAERILSAFLSALRAGESVESTELYAEYPEQSGELRALYEQWLAVSGALDRAQLPGIQVARDAAAANSGGAFGVSDSEVGSRLLEGVELQVGASSRYELREEVDRGGMGAILRIWDKNLRRELAMKVLLGYSAETAPSTTRHDVSLGRFLEEAQVTGQLDHPGIVPVHELGLDSDGRVYFTMRLVKGQNLANIFPLANAETEGWTRTRALGVLLRVCEAMSYAHSKGVVHRDLKPANIMVGRFGEVYVMDWGLSRVLGRKDNKDIRLKTAVTSQSLESVRRDEARDTPDSPLVTMDGTVVGTPSFMAPEQARGEIELVDRRSDVYSVGAMLYQLLSGQMPYVPEGARVSPHTILAAVLQGSPTRVEELTSSIPPELVAICEKAMSRNADERYVDMLAMAEDLRAFLEHRVVQAHQTGAWAEARKWIRRNRAFAASIVALVVVLVTSLGVVARVQTKGRSAERAQRQLAQTNAEEALKSAAFADQQKRLADERSVQLQALAEKERLRADSERRRAEREAAQAYAANLRNALDSFDRGELDGARESLERCDEAQRAWEWSYLREIVDSVKEVPGSVTAFDVRPDRRAIAVGGSDGSVRELSQSLGSTRELDLGASVRIVRYDASGDYLAAAGEGGRVAVWSASRRPLDALEVSFEPEDLVFDDEGRISRSVFDKGAALVLLANGAAWVWQYRSSYQWSRVLFENLSVGWRVYGETNLDMPDRVAQVFGDSAVFGNSAVEDARIEPRRAQSLGADSPWARGVTVAGRGNVAGNDSRESVPLGASTASKSRDGTSVLTGFTDGRIEMRAAGGAVAATLPAIAGGSVQSLVELANGSWLSANASGALRVWSPGHSVQRSVELGDDVLALTFGADGRLHAGLLSGDIATVDSVGDDPIVWSGQGRYARSVHPLDGGGLIAATRATNLAEWASSRSAEPSPIGSPAGLYSLELDATGSRLVTGSYDGSVRLWDRGTGTLLAELLPAVGPGLLATATMDRDGKLVAAGSFEGALSLWDVESRAVRHQLQAHAAPIICLAFDSIGQRVLSASDQGRATVWNTQTGSVVTELVGHTERVHSAVFLPGDNRILTGSADKTALLWDAQTGQLLLKLEGHDQQVTSVTCSPDGRLLATGALGGRICVWGESLGREAW